MKLLFLFATFFRIGLFSIGGGLATLPYLFDLADNSRGINADSWLTREMIGNMLAVSQSLPGAIGANLSAYTGLRYAFIPGGYVAALGLIAPSIIIIIIIAGALKAFKESKMVKSLFAGFRPAAAGLLSAACFGAIAISVGNTSAGGLWYNIIRWKEFLIFLVFLFFIVKFKKHPVVYIVAAGAVGIILKL